MSPATAATTTKPATRRAVLSVLLGAHVAADNHFRQIQEATEEASHQLLAMAAERGIA